MTRVRILFVLFLFLTFINHNLAYSASSGTVTITGTVPSACDITVFTESGATIADLTTGATNLHVATVTENCNDPDGYTVTMVGTNSTDHTGLFIDSVSSDTLAFTVTYDSVSVASGGVVTDVNTTSGGDVSKDVDITYSADSSLTASASNTYSETLTFTIAAK